MSLYTLQSVCRRDSEFQRDRQSTEENHRSVLRHVLRTTIVERSHIFYCPFFLFTAETLVSQTAELWLVKSISVV